MVKKVGKARMQTSTPAISEGERAANKQAGFTLIELALVLLILGVLLTLALPRLAFIGEQRLDSAARRLAVVISYLHDESALRGRIYRLTFDLDRDSYAVEVERPYAKDVTARDFSEQWDPYARSARLPEGIDIVAVRYRQPTPVFGLYQSLLHCPRTTSLRSLSPWPDATASSSG